MVKRTLGCYAAAESGWVEQLLALVPDYEALLPPFQHGIRNREVARGGGREEGKDLFGPEAGHRAKKLGKHCFRVYIYISLLIAYIWKYY